LITIAEAIQKAEEQLIASSETPLLDAEVLLAEILRVSRSHLFAFSERELTLSEINAYEKLIEQRKQHIPVAYITGHKEFWSLNFKVTRDTLIPRPETELLVERVLQQFGNEKIIMADLGTGSGAIALSLAYERPAWEIHATDKNNKALNVARDNAVQLCVPQVIFHEGDWLFALPSGKQFDVIVSNPPYISPDDPFLEKNKLKYEPQSALLAEDNGLKELRHIIKEAKIYLKPGGVLLLEHGFKQAAEVVKTFENMGYSEINTYPDLAGLDRVTGGTV
jgi:release factor glutamine methyltransferase